MIQILYSEKGKIPEKMKIEPSAENFLKLVSSCFDVNYIDIGQDTFCCYVEKGIDSKKVFFRLEGDTEQSLSDLDVALLSGWVAAEKNENERIYNKAHTCLVALKNCSDEYGQCNCSGCSYENENNCFHSLYLDYIFILGAVAYIKKLNGKEDAFIIKKAIAQCLQKNNCKDCPFDDYEYCGRNLRSNIQSSLLGELNIAY